MRIAPIRSEAGTTHSERQEPVVLEHRGDRGAVLLVPLGGRDRGVAARRCSPAVRRRRARGRAASSTRGSRRPGCASTGPGPRARDRAARPTAPPAPTRRARSASRPSDTHSTSRTRSNCPWSISPGCSDDAGWPNRSAERPMSRSEPRIVLVDDLRADDPHVLDADPDRRLHEPADGIPVERRGRLDDQDEVGALRHRAVERGAHGAGGPERALVPQHPSRAERSIEQLPRSVVRAVVDREDAEPRVRLVREREEAVAQPRGSPGPTTISASTLGVAVPVDAMVAVAGEVIRWAPGRCGSLAAGARREQRRGASAAPLRDADELAISASSRRSSCEPACAPRSSCGPWPSCGPACERRPSCGPACERRSSCGPRPSCGPACERRSSCALRSSCGPACGPPSSCAAVFLRAGFRAAVFLAAVFRRAGFRARRLLRCRLPTCRLPGRRLLRGGPLPRGCLPCCHSVPLSFVGNEGSCAYDAIRLRRRRSRSLIPPHTPYRSSRRSA